MTESIKHRGPDDEGYFIFDHKTATDSLYSGAQSAPETKQKFKPIDFNSSFDLCIGFRRLSIIDLSVNGFQPMQTFDKQYTISFNGEIYNFNEIKKELSANGILFKSNTDTEVILESYRKWGKDCVDRLKGMWAFVIYDAHKDELFCSRDRFGIKPLYYYSSKEVFAFASEIKALLHLIPYEPNPSAILKYIEHGITDNDKDTFFKDIYQVKPGHNVTVRKDGLTEQKYYDISSKRHKISPQQALDEFKQYFSLAVKSTEVSDVPLGYSLSGGVDSSCIVSLARKMNKKELNTFSLIFPGSIIDESKFIKAVSSEISLDSKETSIDPSSFAEDLENFCFSQEAPFGSVSYYGEFKLRQFIHLHKIKISIEGQGADEIISGYSNLLLYYFLDLLTDLKFLKLKREITHFNNSIDISLTQVVRSFFRIKFKRYKQLQNKRYPFIDFELLKSRVKTQTIVPTTKKPYLKNELIRQLTLSSIPEQLIRADKNAMAFSVESRFPFLDHELVEYAMNLPNEYKINAGYSKVILRESLKGIIPETIRLRKDKIGFAVPTNELISTEAWNKINNFLENNEFDFIDVKQFRTVYPSIEKVDWIFWKVASLIIWDKIYKNYSKSVIGKN